MNWWQLHGHQVVSALVFTGIGIGAFALFFMILPHLLPFNLKKEIEEDQNTSLGIIIGSIVIGMALIIAAAIGGG